MPQVLWLSLLETNEVSPEALLAGVTWLLEHDYLTERGPLRTGYTLTAKGVAALQTRK